MTLKGINEPTYTTFFACDLPLALDPVRHSLKALANGLPPILLLMTMSKTNAMKDCNSVRVFIQWEKGVILLSVVHIICQLGKEAIPHFPTKLFTKMGLPRTGEIILELVEPSVSLIFRQNSDSVPRRRPRLFSEAGSGTVTDEADRVAFRYFI